LLRVVTCPPYCRDSQPSPLNREFVASTRYNGWPHNSPRRGIISSCQSAATSKIVKRFWARAWLVFKQRYSKYLTFTFTVTPPRHVEDSTERERERERERELEWSRLATWWRTGGVMYRRVVDALSLMTHARDVVKRRLCLTVWRPVTPSSDMQLYTFMVCRL